MVYEIIEPGQEKALALLFTKNKFMEVVNIRVKMQTRYVKKWQQYLTELIGDDYMEWEGRKILISAPTGMGKTTFILQVFLRYFKRKRKKVLILSNRVLLRTQYWSSLLEQFVEYRDIEESVTVMTYQQLEEKVKSGAIEGVFNEYAAIVCDECHFFYADADFNNFGTFVLLQAIARAGATKQ